MTSTSLFLYTGTRSVASIFCLSRFRSRRKETAFRNVNSSTSSTSSASSTPSLPKSSAAQVRQAAEAARHATDDGITLQTIVFDLPLIGATDLDDWPGGIRQQYQAVLPMVFELLKTIAGSGEVKQRVIEDTDGIYAVALKENVAVTFPTAETLDELRRLVVEKTKKSLVLCNPQWSTSGNIIGDFGIGPWRKRSEDFVAQFQTVYSLEEKRIRGESVRVLRAYPHPWQVFVVSDVGDIETLRTFTEKPTYRELETLLLSRKGSVATLDWVERVKREAKFNSDSLQRPSSKNTE